MNEPEITLTSTLELVRWLGWAQMKAAEEWIRARDLSHSQGFVLGYLVDNPGAIQRDIAQITRTSAASVSSLLQGLERRNLVERRTEIGDERRKRVYATPAGGSAPGAAKGIAAFSLVAWVLIIFFGRMLMYNDTLLMFLGM